MATFDSLDKIFSFWCFGIPTWPIYMFSPEFPFSLFFYLMHPSKLQYGRILLSFFVIMILVFGLTHCQFLPAKPTEPVPYTNENRGHCECGNISQGFHTYTFWIGEMQRCFTVYHPVSREKEKLPVFFLVKFLCSGSTGKTRI